MEEREVRAKDGESLETEEMRDCKVRGDLWVSRLNAEQEADMMRRMYQVETG